MSATQGMWDCEHGVDGRDHCEKCFSPAPLDLDAIRTRHEDSLAETGFIIAGRASTTAADVPALIAEVERLRAAVRDAVQQLDAEHRPAPNGGCSMSFSQHGSWPCVTRMVADELRALVGEKEGL